METKSIHENILNNRWCLSRKEQNTFVNLQCAEKSIIAIKCHK